MAADVSDNPFGYYALANDYDASPDGNYRDSVVQTELHGGFEGLGHAIKYLAIHGTRSHRNRFGLFSQISAEATVASVVLHHAAIVATEGVVGTLVGDNHGRLVDAKSDGAVNSPSGYVGGLVGQSDGQIVNSSSSAAVSGRVIGGLVGYNHGTIALSSATGSVSAGGDFSWAGGLVGLSDGQISLSYATGPVSTTAFVDATGALVGIGDNVIEDCYATGAASGFSGGQGGLIGSASSISIGHSYSTGAIAGNADASTGGFIGIHNTNYGGVLEDDYWDLDTSGISDPSQGAGNIANDSGITGLSDAQLKSGLPAGFDPTIWGQSPSINNGYPYLLANPAP